FFFQAEDGIRDWSVTGVQTCALPISRGARSGAGEAAGRGRGRRVPAQLLAAALDCVGLARGRRLGTARGRLAAAARRPARRRVRSGGGRVGEGGRGGGGAAG